jgi:hypothetical protein
MPDLGAELTPPEPNVKTSTRVVTEMERAKAEGLRIKAEKLREQADAHDREANKLDPPEPFEWNNSALTTLQLCGEKFRRLYLERERIPPPPRVLRGSVVHRMTNLSHMRQLKAKIGEGLHSNISAKLLMDAVNNGEGGKYVALLSTVLRESLPSLEEVRDLTSDEFEARWSEGVTLGVDKDDDALADETNSGVIKAESKDYSLAVSAFHVTDVAPKVNPVGVERKITVRPKDSAIVLHGTMDLLDLDIFTATEGVRDYKTTAASPPKAAAHNSQQLTMYGMLRMAETGQLPQRYSLDYLVRTPKRKELKHVLLSTDRTTEDVSSLIKRINIAVETVRKGAFVPADPGAPGSPCGWCQFRPTCVYVKRVHA